jgi:hypothetical protein
MLASFGNRSAEEPCQTRLLFGIQQAAAGETIQGLRFTERGPFAFRAGKLKA